MRTKAASDTAVRIRLQKRGPALILRRLNDHPQQEWSRAGASGLKRSARLQRDAGGCFTRPQGTRRVTISPDKRSQETCFTDFTDFTDFFIWPEQGH